MKLLKKHLIRDPRQAKFINAINFRMPGSM